MCLVILAQITKTSKKRIGAKRLAERTGLYVTKKKLNGETALHFSVSGGCSCEFLGKAYDAEASVWTLDPEHLDKLHNAVSILGKETDSFSFIAFFLGSERPEEARESTLQELKNDIKNNRVRNNALYSINTP